MKYKVGEKVRVVSPRYYNGQLQDRIGKIQKIRRLRDKIEYLTIFSYTPTSVMPVWLGESEIRKLTPLESAMK